MSENQKPPQRGGRWGALGEVLPLLYLVDVFDEVTRRRGGKGKEGEAAKGESKIDDIVFAVLAIAFGFLFVPLVCVGGVVVILAIIKWWLGAGLLDQWFQLFCGGGILVYVLIFIYAVRKWRGPRQRALAQARLELALLPEGEKPKLAEVIKHVRDALGEDRGAKLADDAVRQIFKERAREKEKRGGWFWIGPICFGPPEPRQEVEEDEAPQAASESWFARMRRKNQKPAGSGWIYNKIERERRARERGEK